MEEASYLMDRPAGGWSELVTNHTLDLKFEVLDERFRTLEARIEASADQLRAEMERGFRAQTWRLITVVVAALGSLTAIFAVIAALVAG